MLNDLAVMTLNSHLSKDYQYKVGDFERADVVGYRERLMLSKHPTGFSLSRLREL